jgi:hypothetical protein
MLANTKIALATALILGAASAAHAQKNVVKSYDGLSGQARGSYAQSPTRPSHDADPSASTGAMSRFERTWFDYQSHDDQ